MWFWRTWALIAFTMISHPGVSVLGTESLNYESKDQQTNLAKCKRRLGRLAPYAVLLGSIYGSYRFARDYYGGIDGLYDQAAYLYSSPKFQLERFTQAWNSGNEPRVKRAQEVSQKIWVRGLNDQSLSGSTRASAFYNLAKVNFPSPYLTIDVARKFLADQAREVRHEAARYLLDLSPDADGYENAVVQLLKDGYSTEALSAAAFPGRKYRFHPSEPELENMNGWSSPEVLRAAINEINTRGPAQTEAVYALGQFKKLNSEAIVALYNFLTSTPRPSWQVFATGVETLAKQGERSAFAVPALLRIGRESLNEGKVFYSDIGQNLKKLGVPSEIAIPYYFEAWKKFPDSYDNVSLTFKGNAILGLTDYAEHLTDQDFEFLKLEYLRISNDPRGTWAIDLLYKINPEKTLSFVREEISKGNITITRALAFCRSDNLLLSLEVDLKEWKPFHRESNLDEAIARIDRLKKTRLPN